jgi:hypothetical protein
MRKLRRNEKTIGAQHSTLPQIESIESRRYFSIAFAAPKALPRSAKETNLGSIVEGDFGNGHPDIAALDQGPNGTAGNIQVFLNNGAGRFTLNQTLPTGSGSQVMQAVDLYGTGKLDLIVSNAGDGTLDIFTGDGNGTFSTTPVIFSFGPPEVFNGSTVFSDPFQVGALLGPGQPNGIVIANQYDNNTLILQLDASEQLNIAQTFPIALDNFALVDVTGDALPDIVQASETDVTAYTNLGGTFDSTMPLDFPLNLPTGYASGFQKITTGDFAGNGLTDLAVSAQPSTAMLEGAPGTPGVVSVLMAQPDGGFAPAVLSNEPSDDQGDIAADVNLDGVLDLITQSANSSDVLTGNGDGTFTDQNLHIPNAGTGQSAMADFNGDGTVDIVTADSKSVLALYANKSVSPDFGSADLSPIVTRTTLPPAIVAGATARGTATVDVTNTDTAKEQALVTTSVYASSDGLFDDASVLLGSVTRKLFIKPGATLPVVVQIKSLPSSLNGTYMLLAQTSNVAGVVATETGPAITITAPFIAFTDTFAKTTLATSAVSGQKTRAAVQVNITNNGNIVSKGTTTIAIYASADGIAADGTLIRSLTTSVPLRPGASRTVNVPLLTLPAVADGDYFLLAQVTDPQANVTTAVSPATYHLAAPFVMLTPAITSTTVPVSVTVGSRSNAAVSLILTDDGNIAAIGTSTIAVYASIDGLAADGTLLVSQPLHAPIQPARSVKARASLKNFTQLPPGTYFLVIVVTDPSGGVQTAMSANTYAVTP